MCDMTSMQFMQFSRKRDDRKTRENARVAEPKQRMHGAILPIWAFICDARTKISHI